ncbi:hypothetical protein AB0G81_04995 [Streptomyces asoensis]
MSTGPRVGRVADHGHSGPRAAGHLARPPAARTVRQTGQDGYVRP